MKKERTTSSIIILLIEYTHRVIPIEEYKFQKEKIGDYKLTHYIIYNDPLKTKHRKIKEPQNNINLI